MLTLFEAVFKTCPERKFSQCFADTLTTFTGDQIVVLEALNSVNLLINLLRKIKKFFA